MLSIDSLEEKMMLTLFFANPVSVVTTLVLVAILTILILTFLRRSAISNWGRLLALIILIGTAASATSAARDGYAMEGALFPVDGAITLICGVAGGMIYLTGLVCLIWRRQSVRRAGFFVAAGLMAVQIAVVEGSRVLLLMGGRL
jgi:hypothetical protein